MAADAGFAQTFTRFVELFPNRLGSSIMRSPSPTWREVSRFHYLSDDEILESLQTNAKVQRALRLDDKSRFAVISIPSASIYQNPDDIARLKRLFDSLSIHTVLYQANDDWHLYLFFTQNISLDEFVSVLSERIARSGFIVSEDTIHVIASDKAAALPLQAEFSWLDDFGQVALRRAGLTLEDALKRFLFDSVSCANDPLGTIAILKEEAELEPLSKRLVLDSRMEEFVVPCIDESLAKQEAQENNAKSPPCDSIVELDLTDAAQAAVPLAVDSNDLSESKAAVEADAGIIGQASLAPESQSIQQDVPPIPAELEVAIMAQAVLLPTSQQIHLDDYNPPVDLDATVARPADLFQMKPANQLAECQSAIEVDIGTHMDDAKQLVLFRTPGNVSSVVPKHTELRKASGSGSSRKRAPPDSV